MKVIPICPGSAMANCYLLVHGTHALVVDPCVTIAGIRRALRMATDEDIARFAQQLGMQNGERR